MKKQLRSFGHAFAGIGNALRTEAHLRFHLAAALLVLTAAAICGFSPERLAVLWVLSGLVIALSGSVDRGGGSGGAVLPER